MGKYTEKPYRKIYGAPRALPHVILAGTLIGRPLLDVTSWPSATKETSNKAAATLKLIGRLSRPSVHLPKPALVKCLGPSNSCGKSPIFSQIVVGYS